MWPFKKKRKTRSNERVILPTPENTYPKQPEDPNLMACFTCGNVFTISSQPKIPIEVREGHWSDREPQYRLYCREHRPKYARRTIDREYRYHYWIHQPEWKEVTEDGRDKEEVEREEREAELQKRFVEAEYAYDKV